MKIGRIAFWIVLLLGLGIAGCSKPSYIEVRYALPPTSDSLTGMQMGLVIRDDRTDKSIFAGKAKEEFQYFTGIYALSLARGDDGTIVGTYELPGLFREAFRQRMVQFGIDVVNEPAGKTPMVEIVLKQFVIEAEGQKWLADISYEGRLLVDGQMQAAQMVAGKAERVKLIGHGDAEKVIGEIFTDSVNKFDLVKLLGKAGL